MNAPTPAAYSQTLGIQASVASTLLARASTATRSVCLRRLAPLLRDNTASLQTENQKDLTRATAASLAAPMVDRLKLTPRIIGTVAQGCEQLAAMPDVIGEISGMREQPSGIRVGQMRVPIEAASLSIKSGNACNLRGGSKAIDSHRALALLVQTTGRAVARA